MPIDQLRRGRRARVWSAGEDSTIRAMRAGGAIWKEVAAALGLSVLLVRKRGDALGGPALVKPTAARIPEAPVVPRQPPGTPWTAVEDAYLLGMEDAGAAWGAMGRHLGRDRRACAARWETLQEPAPKPTKPRRCLKCSAVFDSEGPGNRMCPTCAEANAEIGCSIDHGFFGLPVTGLD